MNIVIRGLPRGKRIEGQRLPDSDYVLVADLQNVPFQEALLTIAHWLDQQYGFVGWRINGDQFVRWDSVGGCRVLILYEETK